MIDFSIGWTYVPPGRICRVPPLDFRSWLVAQEAQYPKLAQDETQGYSVDKVPFEKHFSQEALVLGGQNSICHSLF